jgi:DNA-binding response OmpR family regulator
MNKRILLIEDDEMIRDLYKTVFSSSGLFVDDVGTGENGLESLMKNHYDLVLLDMMLPGIDGIEVLTRLKQMPNIQVKVVVLSNLGQEDVIKKAMDLGAIDYVSKVALSPYDLVKELDRYMQ